MKETLKNKQQVLVYDGVCNLCLSTVAFVRHFLNPKRIQNYHFQTFQTTSEDERTEYSLDLSSVVLLKHDSKTKKLVILKKSDAILTLAQDFRQPLGALAFITRSLVPRCLRDSVYMFIAKYRYRIFGKKEEICNDQCFRKPENFKRKSR